MLINTRIIDEVDGIGESKKKNIEEYYKNLSLFKRIFGVKGKEK